MEAIKLKDAELWNKVSFELHKDDPSDSAYVMWHKTENLDHFQDKKKGDKAREEILSFLKTLNGCGMRPSKIAEHINKARPYVAKLLEELYEQGKCKKYVENPKKEFNNHNPYVFSI